MINKLLSMWYGKVEAHGEEDGMQETLVIYLASEQPDWAIVDENSHVRQSALQDQPEGLAAIAEEKRVVVIVPAEDVLLTNANMPPLTGTKLAQAIPFVLEDQLINEIEALHFAIAERQANQYYPVAVVTHEKMQHWLNQLTEWHIKPDVILPASLALPITQTAWYGAIIKNKMIVRTGQFSGFVADVSQLSTWIELAITSQSESPQILYLYDYQTSLSNQLVASLHLSFAIEFQQKEKTAWLSDMATQVAHAPTMNLLQGPYARKKAIFPSFNKLWKITIGLAVAWVALLILYPMISYFILSSRLNQMESQINTIYFKHFPQASAVIAPKVRMQEKMARLSSGINDNRLLRLLAFVGEALKKTSSIKLKRLDFQNNQLTLELSAASSDDFAAFIDFLNRQGLNVKQQNATLDGARVNAILDIE
jgi:general secretion pathway protein L